MHKTIFVDAGRCVGCLACETACERENPGGPFVRAVIAGNRFAMPLTCRQCDPAPCVMVCPAGALVSMEETIGVVPEKCTGCSLCLFACPFGMMRFDSDRKIAANCDLCAKRGDGKSDPACVRTCPSGALFFETFPDFAARGRRIASAFIARSMQTGRV